MGSGFRFDPPQVELSAELGWVLARAFGPVSAPLPQAGELRGELVVELAERLDLAERIAARMVADALSGEVGEEAVGFFVRARTGCAARALIIDRVCREVAEVGADRGVPVIFLKGAALQLGGWIEPGSRSMSDVDVLVADGAARPFQDALIGRGCRSPEAPESEHQLQLLTHPTGLGIEVHRMIPGVRLGGGRSATADELVERDLVRAVAGMPGGCRVPAPDVLMAHALVHGIAQHGLAPDNYPWSRFLADVRDLGAGGVGSRETVETTGPWIEREVTPAEVGAVLELVDRLGRGDDPLEIAAGGDLPAKLIRHLVAGATMPTYVESMRLARRARSLSDRPRWKKLAVDGWRTVWLTRTQVDQLYGPPKSELGYWARRLWRPFDLVGRAWRYGLAAARHKVGKR
jgi:hypothetical protein